MTEYKNKFLTIYVYLPGAPAHETAISAAWQVARGLLRLDVFSRHVEAVATKALSAILVKTKIITLFLTGKELIINEIV